MHVLIKEDMKCSYMWCGFKDIYTDMQCEFHHDIQIIMYEVNEI